MEMLGERISGWCVVKRALKCGRKDTGWNRATAREIPIVRGAVRHAQVDRWIAVRVLIAIGLCRAGLFDRDTAIALASRSLCATGGPACVASKPCIHRGFRGGVLLRTAPFPVAQRSVCAPASIRTYRPADRPAVATSERDHQHDPPRAEPRSCPLYNHNNLTAFYRSSAQTIPIAALALFSSRHSPTAWSASTRATTSVSRRPAAMQPARTHAPGSRMETVLT